MAGIDPWTAARPAQSDSGTALLEMSRPVTGRSDRAWATDSIRQRGACRRPETLQKTWCGDCGATTRGPGETTSDTRALAPLGKRRGRLRRPLFEKEAREDVCRAYGTRPETKRSGPPSGGPFFGGWGWAVGKTYTGPVGASATRQFEPLGSMKVSDTSTDCASDRTYFRKPPRSASPSARLSRSASNRNVPSSAVSILKSTL